MQAYGPSFARVYDKKWRFFAQRIAPWLRLFYESQPVAQQSRAVLDVCCGAGHLASFFLENGYTVTGIDLSEHMLHYARQNNAAYAATGRARFIQADAAHFSVEGPFGLAVSTFDALNHLPDQAALRGCFESVYPLLLPDGWFIFDLNTRTALLRWNNISVDDDPECMIVNRGLYDEQSGKAWMFISGFVCTGYKEDGTPLYERFQETVYNVIYDLNWVRQTLREVGFSIVYMARIDDLHTPLEEPEKEGRVFFVAQK